MFTVKLKDIINEFQLEPVFMDESGGDIEITTSDVNRPGLQLSGYMEHFGTDRIQIIGKVETG
jgi:HPr kinase/phosphorylase